MFNKNDTYYFASIRRNTAAFGTMFDGVHIHRYSGNANVGTVVTDIKVPLAYAETQKWLNHMKEYVAAPLAYEDVRHRKNRVRMSLPRMSFEMTGLQYDPSRKLQSLGGVSAPKIGNAAQFISQLNPVPYDLAYELNIAVKNIDDGLQIIEQIVPIFVPSFNLSVKEMPELGITRDVSVLFSGISKQDNYEGSYEEDRIITWTLSFVMKAYIYPNVVNAGIIKQIITNIKDMDTLGPMATVEDSVDPLSAGFNDVWSVKNNIFQAPEQFDSNGNPIEDSNGNPIPPA